jgi:hypothetical protein
MPARNTRKRSRARAPAQTQEDRRRKWAQRIRATWARAVKAFVETGKQLNAAKDDLPHGEFSYMIYNELPFSDSTAERLMAIARHKVLSKSAHVRHLPAHWSTLYELSRLPAKKVAALIKDGTISAKMERSEAQSLVMREQLVQRGKELPAAPRTSGSGIVRFTPHVTPRGYVRYVPARPPDPTLDDSTPSEDVAPELRALAAQARRINEPPIDRYEVLLAAWNACSEDEQARFRATINACRLS